MRDHNDRNGPGGTARDGYVDGLRLRRWRREGGQDGGVGKGGDAVGARPRRRAEGPRPVQSALDALNGHDKANDWNDATCADVAKQFLAAASANQNGKFAEATYDAGLAYQRCGDDKDAKAQFEQALADDPKFHYARAQLALYQYKADGNEDAAISSPQQAVLDAQFQDVPGARQPRDVPDDARLRPGRRQLQYDGGCKGD